MSRRTSTRAFSAVALGVAAVVALSASFAAGPAGAAETVDPRLALAQANVQAYCTDLADDATTTRQRNTRADLCAMWKRQLADLTPATSSPTVAPTTTAPTTTAPPTTTPAPTTSSPTPSPTASPTGWPDASTTGVPPGTMLKVSTGNRTVTLPGAVIDGEEIRGCLVIAADNVTVKNSRILGDGCFYAVQNKALNLTMQDVEIACGNTSGTGVTAANYTLYRADISGCENGLNIGGNVAMFDSWIHGLVLPAGAHTDGVQMNEGAGNILLRGNSFEVPQWATSSIIMWDESGAQNFNVLVDNNRLTGGGYVIYCPRQASSNVRVVNNRIGNWGYGPQNSCWSPNVAEFSGNTRLDGSPL